MLSFIPPGPFGVVVVVLLVLVALVTVAVLTAAAAGWCKDRAVPGAPRPKHDLEVIDPRS